MENEGLTAIAKMEVARLLPGDVLVVSLRDGYPLCASDMERFRDQLRRAFPAWVTVVVMEGVDCKIVRKGDGGETGEANKVERTEREPG